MITVNSKILATALRKIPSCTCPARIESRQGECSLVQPYNEQCTIIIKLPEARGLGDEYVTIDKKATLNDAKFCDGFNYGDTTSFDVCWNVDYPTISTYNITKLAAIMPFVSKDPTRITCNYIQLTGGATIATDNFAAAMINDCGWVDNLCVHRETAEILIKLFKGKTVYVSNSPKEYLFEYGNVMVVVVPQDITFPPYQKIFNIQKTSSLTLTREDMLATMATNEKIVEIAGIKFWKQYLVDMLAIDDGNIQMCVGDATVRFNTRNNSYVISPVRNE